MDEWSTLEISCSLSVLASSHTWALTHKKHDHLGPESSFQAYYGTTNMHYSHCFVHPPSFSAEQPDKAWANTNCRRRRVMEWNGWLKRINSPWHPCIDMECSCVTWSPTTHKHTATPFIAKVPSQSKSVGEPSVPEAPFAIVFAWPQTDGLFLAATQQQRQQSVEWVWVSMICSVQCYGICVYANEWVIVLGPAGPVSQCHYATTRSLARILHGTGAGWWLPSSSVI